MVPTRRPSPNTSILAPTRCGVEPVVDTMVTSAAGSPRSSASATAAKTSWFICCDYKGAPSELVHQTLFHGLCSSHEGFGNCRGAVGGSQLPAGRADAGKGDALRYLKRHAGAASQRTHHKGRPDGQRRLGARQPNRLIVVESHPHHREELRRESNEPRVAQIVRRAGFAGGFQPEPG